jgi:hypothetical protein
MLVPSVVAAVSDRRRRSEIDATIYVPPYSIGRHPRRHKLGVTLKASFREYPCCRYSKTNLAVRRLGITSLVNGASVQRRQRSMTGTGPRRGAVV